MDPKEPVAPGDQTTNEPPIAGDQVNQAEPGGDQTAIPAEDGDEAQTEHRDVAKGRAPALPLESAVGIEAASLAAGVEVPLSVQQALAADPEAAQAAREAHAELVKAAKAAKPKSKTKKPATAGKPKE